LFDLLRKPATGQRGGGGGGSRPQDSITDGLAAADKKLEQTYTVAYIAHAPLEPRAAVAEWNGDKLTVWTGSQRPFGVRNELVEAFHISEDKVRVIVPDTGSGYGGKHTGECAVEAARLAKAAGKPVKLVWTREENTSAAYVAEARSKSILHSRNIDSVAKTTGSGAERLVKPGQTATLTWEQAGLRIVLPVTCLDAGGLGEFVRVRFKNAARILRAEVMGKATLRASL